MNEKDMHIDVLKDYSKFLSYAKKYYMSHNYERALRILFFASGFMYSMNQKFFDEEAELLTSSIGKLLIGETESIKEQQKDVVFYDAFGDLRKGLSGIYVKALQELGYHLHYITYENYGQAEVDDVSYIKGKTFLAQIKSLKAIIEKFGTSLCFLNLTPDDVVGVAVFSNCKRRKKYLLNTTDHAFWLGRNVFDYIVNFREFGAKLCVDKREIPKERVLYLPYYPNPMKKQESMIVNKIPSTLKCIFSGGAEYKTFSNDQTYYKMVEYILSQYEDFIFVFVGKGNHKYWSKLKKKYGNRILVQNDTDEFFEIMKNCLFYFSTYPYNGGLMTQYALLAQKIPVTLSASGIESELTIKHNENFWNFKTVDECKNEIERIILDTAYREKREKQLAMFLVTASDFVEELQFILNNGRSKREILLKAYQSEGFSYYPLEYYSGLSYFRFFFRKKGLILAIVFPIKFILGIFSLLSQKIDGWRYQ